MREATAPPFLVLPDDAVASFDVRAGRQSVRVHVFGTVERLRQHAHAVDRYIGLARPFPRRLMACTWGVEGRVGRSKRRTGVCAVVTVAQDDPALMETLAHEAVHAALRVLARRGVDVVSTAWKGGPAREEALATVAGMVAAATNREMHRRGLYALEP